MLIRGAGATGVLAWHTANLSRTERDSLLVCNRGLCSGASAHAQCIIHRGYTYAGFNEKLVADLREASGIWDELIGTLNIPHSRGIAYGFKNPQSFIDFGERVSAKQLKPLATGTDVRRGGVADRQDAISTLEAIRENLFAERLVVSDEVVVRPIDALAQVVSANSDRAGPAIDVANQFGFELQALGRDKFQKSSNNGTPATDEFMLAATGNLPKVNGVFPSLLRISRKDEIHRNVEVRFKKAHLMVISHQLSNGKVLWLISSNILTARQKPKKPNPKMPQVRKPSPYQVDFVAKMLRMVFPCFAIAQNHCNWKSFWVQLPDLRSIENNVQDRCVVKAPTKQRLFLYSERFTLAPLVARVACEAAQQHLQVQDKSVHSDIFPMNGTLEQKLPVWERSNVENSVEAEDWDSFLEKLR